MTAKISRILLTLLADLNQFDFQETTRRAGMDVALRSVSALKKRSVEAFLDQQQLLDDECERLDDGESPIIFDKRY